jgi:glutathione S-transferase
MKLYDTPLAPNPRRVRWVMAEKTIDDIEVITLNLIEGQQ